MDAIEKAIADFVHASTGTRLQAAMRAAGQRDDSGRDDSGRDDTPPELAPDPRSMSEIDATSTPTSGHDIMATPTDLATAIDQPRGETYSRSAFPKAPTQPQLAVSLKLKARAMRAVLLALNEGHTPWDEFSAEHVRAYEAICDQLTACLHSKRRDRVS